jgi:hypothetical protein
VPEARCCSGGRRGRDDGATSARLRLDRKNQDAYGQHSAAINRRSAHCSRPIELPQLKPIHSRSWDHQLLACPDGRPLLRSLERGAHSHQVCRIEYAHYPPIELLDVFADYGRNAPRSFVREVTPIRPADRKVRRRRWHITIAGAEQGQGQYWRTNNAERAASEHLRVITGPATTGKTVEQC